MTRTKSPDATYDQWLAKHTLEAHVETPQLQAYYLRPAGGGRMQSVFIIFSKEGIVICGDWCPNDNEGAISAYGYGRDWFSGKLSAGYLAEKFLRHEYIPEVGAEDLKRHIIQARRAHADRPDSNWHVTKEAAREAFDRVGSEIDYSELAEIFYEVTPHADLSDRRMGQTYERRSHALLCAIQRRFAQLWAEHVASQEVAA